MDREKIIKGLECLARKQEQAANPCSKCGYHDRPNFAFCVVDIASDVLALLKEQRQVIRKQRQKERPDGAVDCFAEWYCPHCGSLLKRGYEAEWIKYCFKCGRPVTWEGR